MALPWKFMRARREYIPKKKKELENVIASQLPRGLNLQVNLEKVNAEMPEDPCVEPPSGYTASLLTLRLSEVKERQQAKGENEKERERAWVRVCV